MQSQNEPLEQMLQSAMACIQANDFARAQFYLDALQQQADARIPYCKALIAQACGNHEEAIRAFAQAAELNNFNLDLTADCIFKLIGYQALDMASTINRSVSEKNPGYFGFHFCSGLIHLQRNELESAVSAFRSTEKLNPGLAECKILLGQTLHMMGRLSEAEDAFLKALQLAPDDARLHENLAALLIDCELPQAAYEHAKRAVSLSRQSPSAWVLLSTAARQLKLLDEARTSAEQACRLAPDAAESRHCRGAILKDLGDLEKAARDFAFAAGKRFEANSGRQSNLREHRFLTRAKIEHDIEQFDYLEKIHGDKKFSALATQYRVILDVLPHAGRTDIMPIPQNLFADMQQHFNRQLHMQPTSFSGTALSASLDTDAVEKDYFARSPGITWIDNLLSPEALAALRRYCLESTLWFDFNHPNGYLGAVFENGFTDPLLLQICDELKNKFPKIFAAHPLMQMWAFKYDSRLQGIQLHGDVAAVNLNFWITPDDANLDQESGGLRIWDKAAPADWSFSEFNSGSEEAQTRVHRFLSDNEAREIVVPYRQNRAVVFNSDLFHATDEFHFREGYENRRINITMLFGLRNSTQ